MRTRCSAKACSSFRPPCRWWFPWPSRVRADPRKRPCRFPSDTRAWVPRWALSSAQRSARWSVLRWDPARSPPSARRRSRRPLRCAPESSGCPARPDAARCPSGDSPCGRPRSRWSSARRIRAWCTRRPDRCRCRPDSPAGYPLWVPSWARSSVRSWPFRWARPARSRRRDHRRSCCSFR